MCFQYETFFFLLCLCSAELQQQLLFMFNNYSVAATFGGCVFTHLGLEIKLRPFLESSGITWFI